MLVTLSAGHPTDARVGPSVTTGECRLSAALLLALVRVAFDVDGTPVEVCDTVMSADHYVLAYELPAD